MFKCDKCFKNFGPGIPQTKVIDETRKIEYPARYTYRGKEFETMEELTEIAAPGIDDENVVSYKMERALERIQCIDAGGSGSEIVRESSICPVCAGTSSLKSFEAYNPKLNIPLHEGTRAYRDATHFRLRSEN